MLKLTHTLVTFFLTSLVASAQVDSIWQQKPKLNISGFVDIYYIYDFNQPQGTER